jgi:hypothetical protein
MFIEEDHVEEIRHDLLALQDSLDAFVDFHAASLDSAWRAISKAMGECDGWEEERILPG